MRRDAAHLLATIVVLGFALWGFMDVIARLLPAGWPL